MAATVGLVGIGLMGTALAHRLIGTGFAVLGIDIDADRLKALEAMGGEAAGSLAEVGGRADRVVLAVLNAGQVEEAVEGRGGLLAGRPEGEGRLILFCASTCEPDRIARLADRVEGRGAVLLDTPVSGTSQQVMRGEGLGLIAGDPTAVADGDDVLAAIYPRRHFLGPAGNASKAKLAINLILGLNRAALAEGLVFAERLGLDKGALLEIARGSAAYSQIMDVKGGKMVDGDFTAQGKLTQSAKDFGIIAETARLAGQDLPLASVYAALVESLIADGKGELDNSAIIEAIRRRRRGA